MPLWVNKAGDSLHFHQQFHQQWLAAWLALMWTVFIIICEYWFQHISQTTRLNVLKMYGHEKPKLNQKLVNPPECFPVKIKLLQLSGTSVLFSEYQLKIWSNHCVKWNGWLYRKNKQSHGWHLISITSNNLHWSPPGVIMVHLCNQWIQTEVQMPLSELEEAVVHTVLWNSVMCLQP